MTDEELEELNRAARAEEKLRKACMKPDRLAAIEEKIDRLLAKFDRDDFDERIAKSLSRAEFDRQCRAMRART